MPGLSGGTGGIGGRTPERFGMALRMYLSARKRKSIHEISAQSFRNQIDVTTRQVALVKDWLVVKRVIFSQKYISPKISPLLAHSGLAVAGHSTLQSRREPPLDFST